MLEIKARVADEKKVQASKSKGVKRPRYRANSSSSVESSVTVSVQAEESTSEDAAEDAAEDKAADSAEATSVRFAVDETAPSPKLLTIAPSSKRQKLADAGASVFQRTRLPKGATIIYFTHVELL